jgi:hypothetical protein
LTPATGQLVSAALALTLSVRARDGIRQHEVDSLLQALHECKREWANQDAIPRIAVNVLVDLQPSLLASAELYDRTIREAIINTAILIGDRVRDAVAI